jgi:hypothetical protein
VFEALRLRLWAARFAFTLASSRAGNDERRFWGGFLETSLIVCFVATGLTASTAAVTGAPVETALFVFGIAGVPVAIVELPFAFSFGTVDLLCGASEV